MPLVGMVVRLRGDIVSMPVFFERSGLDIDVERDDLLFIKPIAPLFFLVFDSV